MSNLVSWWKNQLIRIKISCPTSIIDLFSLFKSPFRESESSLWINPEKIISQLYAVIH